MVQESSQTLHVDGGGAGQHQDFANKIGTEAMFPVQCTLPMTTSTLFTIPGPGASDKIIESLDGGGSPVRLVVRERNLDSTRWTCTRFT